MQERENLIRILEKAKQAIKEENVVLMKELSNRTIHSASIYADADNITLAVIIYSISKIIERKKSQYYDEWPVFFKAVTEGLTEAIKSAKQNDEKGFRNALTGIRKGVEKISGHLHSYIDDVFRKARVNKASRIYEHGISMQQTADILGITAFELAEYSGRTGVGDVDLSITKPAKERIRIAEEIFR